MTFATPAVDSVWPTMPLIPKMWHASRESTAIAAIELTSIGSPSAVPVPWASIKVPRQAWASPRAARIKSYWEKPLSAVNDALCPLCRADEPGQRTWDSQAPASLDGA